MVDALAENVEQWARELRKGSARLGLLVLLSRGESYGYEIVRGLKEQGLLKQGATEATIYPLLHDLASQGYVTSDWRTTANGTPARRYYRLNAEGRKLAPALAKEWRRIRHDIDEIVKDV